jgi:hypothetical protein
MWFPSAHLAEAGGSYGKHRRKSTRATAYLLPLLAETLDVSDDARHDQDEIAGYSIRAWGNDRATRYAASISARLDLLLKFPMLG